MENTVGKVENAGNQHCLFFLTVFSNLSQREIIIWTKSNLSSANAFNLDLDQAKILSFGKDFTTLMEKTYDKIVRK